jgi:hypothetical protein
VISEKKLIPHKSKFEPSIKTSKTNGICDIAIKNTYKKEKRS